jgi:hypothetical protein
MARSLAEAAHTMFRLMLDKFTGLNGKIADLDEGTRGVLARTKYRAD